MKIYEILSEAKQPEPPKPRNFVAKNAKTSGAGAHKDKKRAAKQGSDKHKKSLAETIKLNRLGQPEVQHPDEGDNKHGVFIDGKLHRTYWGKDAAERIASDLRRRDQSKKVTVKPINETATAGSTSSANIGTVINPHHSPGAARGKRSYTGSPGKSGTKAPPQPSVNQPKNADGTAKNGADMPNLFGAPSIKRT